MTKDPIKSARILIVDDEEANIDLVEGILQREGYSAVQSTVDPRRVAALVSDFQPDLILLDLMMPHLDGHAVLDQLRSLIPSDTYLPILVLTADTSAQARKRALSAGAKDFLTKPLEVTETALRIRNLLETRWLHLQLKQRMEEKLRETNQTLEALIQAMPLAVVVLDRERKVTLWSPAAELIFGWTAPEVLGSELPIVPDDGREEYLAHFESALGGTPVLGVELTRRRKNGSPVMVNLWTVPLENAAGTITAVVCIYADITERKKLEARFLRAQRLESVGTLAGGIAHDLNNCLAPMLIMGPVLREQLPPPSQESLDLMINSARRGADIIAQVLTFARGVEGQHAPLQVKHLLKEMVKIIHETFPKNITVKWELGKELWTIQADATQVQQVLMNLCVNARDALPAGGVLSLSAQNVSLDEVFAGGHPGAKAGNFVRVSVADNGTGIPPEIQDRIFEPFFTTKEAGKGTGLGLSTVLGIVQSHDGFVTVESQVGQGTKFEIYLPACLAERAAPEPRAVEAQPPGQGQLILVVEDEPAMRHALEFALLKHGYRTMSAGDGIEALARYSEHRREIQAVVTDLAMPTMDGAMLIRILRRINPQARIIISSGLGAEDKLQEVKSLGIEQVLRKPYAAESLLQALHQALSA